MLLPLPQSRITPEAVLVAFCYRLFTDTQIGVRLGVDVNHHAPLQYFVMLVLQSLMHICQLLEIIVYISRPNHPLLDRFLKTWRAGIWTIQCNQS
ncbi:hypothetical protein GGI1_04854 [Acidithiobacillus sp. GGI-221]|nr:hypothetical protein GGI1_04854 [Acidithiobacillus sp. GGI-221]